MDQAITYIIIDDDGFHNRLCTISINKFRPKAEVISFTEPEQALSHIRNTYSGQVARPTILLLDLNMPFMNGWEFLEQFEEMDKRIKAQLDIYILTSSIDTRDRERAWNNDMICGFMEKPLNEYQLDSMAFVKNLKDASPVLDSAIQTDPVKYYLGIEERQLLEKILPNFQLNEVVQVQKCIRSLQGERPELRNMPTNLYTDNIKSFLIANKFAHNLSGDPLINKKGIDLMMAGSLHEYEKLEHQRAMAS